MKITFVLPHAGLAGGIRVVAIYADRLKKHGHDVFVVSQPLSRPTLKEQVRSILRGKGWIPTPKFKKSHLDLIASDVPHRILERSRAVVDTDVPDADVVIATWWETAEWVAKLSPSKGAKVYFIQHYEIFEYLPVDRVKATWNLPFHKITVAPWLVDIAQKEYNDRDVSLVPNSVDFKDFYAEPRSKQPVPTVGLTYAPVYWKGSDIIFRAVEIARQHIPNLKVLAFGEHVLEEPYSKLKNVTYYRLSNQETIREIYASCDAWMFGSRTEGFGLPILEAMACRTPVIGVPSGIAPELLADGAGILVKPEDPEDMAQAIVAICHLSNEDWQKLSDTAYRKVSNYTWEDATTLFEAALSYAIAQVRVAAPS